MINEARAAVIKDHDTLIVQFCACIYTCAYMTADDKLTAGIKVLASFFFLWSVSDRVHREPCPLMADL